MMRSEIVVLMCLTLAMSLSAAAQTRSVTNASLELYKQQRLTNEREYRENYERLGLPSPEELERRNAQSAKELAELSNKLRTEEFERERISSAGQILTYREPVVIGVSENSIYAYYWTNRRHHWIPGRRQYVQPGYYAGGQFWPTGSAEPSRPMFGPAHR